MGAAGQMDRRLRRGIPPSITGRQKRSATQRCGVQATRTEAGKACLTAGQKTVFGSAGQSGKNGWRLDNTSRNRVSMAGAEKVFWKKYDMI